MFYFHYKSKKVKTLVGVEALFWLGTIWVRGIFNLKEIMKFFQKRNSK